MKGDTQYLKLVIYFTRLLLHLLRSSLSFVSLDGHDIVIFNSVTYKYNVHDNTEASSSSERRKAMTLSISVGDIKKTTKQLPYQNSRDQ